MKRLIPLLLTILALVSTMASAVADTGVGLFLTASKRPACFQVTATKTGSLKRPFGAKFDLDISTLAGNGQGHAALGGALVGNLKVAENATLSLGIGAMGTVKKATVGFYFGASIRF